MNSQIELVKETMNGNLHIDNVLFEGLQAPDSTMQQPK